MTTLSDLPQAARALDAAAQHVSSPIDGQSGTVKWRIWGEGKPLLLIHGGAGSWLHWLKNIDHLVAQGWQVIAPDSPGFGESAALPEGHSLADAAAPVYQGLRQLIGDQILPIVGFSFGGVLSGAIVEQNPTQFSQIVLCGSGGFGFIRPMMEPLNKWRGLDPEAQRAAHRRNLEILMIADPAKIDDDMITVQAYNAEHARGVSRSFSRTPVLAETLARVARPVDGIWGAIDATAIDLLDEREATLRAIDPAARLLRIEGAGHWLPYEAPEAFAASLDVLLMRSQSA